MIKNYKFEDLSMSKYILNINTGAIHNGEKPCCFCKKMKESNKKYFDDYNEAVNFFEGKSKKGNPCGICLKDMDEQPR